MRRKPEWWRYFWVEAGVVTVVSTVLSITSYLLKVWDFYGLARAILLMCCANLLIYAFAQMMADALAQTYVLPFKKVIKESKIAYIISGASYGTVLGTGLAALIYWAFNIPTSELWFTGFLFFGLSAIVGAVIGYWIGKKRGFRTRRLRRSRETL